MGTEDVEKPKVGFTEKGDPTDRLTAAISRAVREWMAAEYPNRALVADLQVSGLNKDDSIALRGARPYAFRITGHVRPASSKRS